MARTGPRRPEPEDPWRMNEAACSCVVGLARGSAGRFEVRVQVGRTVEERPRLCRVVLRRYLTSPERRLEVPKLVRIARRIASPCPETSRSILQQA